ncbi:MAG TPA: HAD-IA family hydrolase [Vicinamibacterales bacterium]|nr:HAD-IA family hydrolase [Vicinamibacterales bacterium]
MVYALYVFDLDGTLVDSRRDIAESANELLETCGASALPEEVVGRMVGNGAPDLVARAFAAAAIEPPADALERFLRIYDRRLLAHTRPYVGIPEVLEALQVRAPLAVLTNKPLAATRSVLDGLGLARFFDADAVVAGDGAFGRKPDPAGLQHLSSRAGVQPGATLLVGDSLVDWQTARNAAAPVCLARYGFGFEDFPVQRLGPADHLIERPYDLLVL